MLPRLNLGRNVTLCGRDVECREPGKEGQGEGGGRGEGKREEGNTLCNLSAQSFVQPPRYFGD